MARLGPLILVVVLAGLTLSGCLTSEVPLPEGQITRPLSGEIREGWTENGTHLSLNTSLLSAEEGAVRLKVPIPRDLTLWVRFGEIKTREFGDREEECGQVRLSLESAGGRTIPGGLIWSRSVGHPVIVQTPIERLTLPLGEGDGTAFGSGDSIIEGLIDVKEGDVLWLEAGARTSSPSDPAIHGIFEIRSRDNSPLEFTPVEEPVKYHCEPNLARASGTYITGSLGSLGPLVSYEARLPLTTKAWTETGVSVNLFPITPAAPDIGGICKVDIVRERVVEASSGFQTGSCRAFSSSEGGHYEVNVSSTIGRGPLIHAHTWELPYPPAPFNPETRA